MFQKSEKLSSRIFCLLFSRLKPRAYWFVAEAMNKTEEESENLHKQLLDREIDLGAFVQKYKRLRTTYHKRALVHLAAKTNSIG